MAASDLAFLEAKKSARSEVLGEESAERQEERQKTADERQDVLFTRSTTLFEQQQDFVKDELRLKRFGRDANSALALFKATGGQVFQPILDLWDEIPDGGKFHQFSRNDDGTFNFDIEWQGQRYVSKGASFEEVGKMAMAIANPVLYLQESGAIASAQAEFEQKKMLAQIKAAGKTEFKIDGKITTKTYFEGRKTFQSAYESIRDNDPDALHTVVDEDSEDGFRDLTLDEYVAGRFDAIGIDISGARIAEDGTFGVRATPPDPLTTTFRAATRFAREELGATVDESLDLVIQDFIDAGRVDELVDNFIGPNPTPGVAGALTPAREAKILAAQSASKAETSSEAAKEDVKQAAIIVRTGGEGEEQEQDPFAVFASQSLSTEDRRNQQRGIQRENLRRGAPGITGQSAVDIGKKTSKARLNRIWADVAKGGGGFSDRKAVAILKLGQTAEGRKKAAKLYSEARSKLSRELQKKLDKIFAQDIVASGAIPEPGSKG